MSADDRLVDNTLDQDRDRDRERRKTSAQASPSPTRRRCSHQSGEEPAQRWPEGEIGRIDVFHRTPTLAAVCKRHRRRCRCDLTRHHYDVMVWSCRWHPYVQALQEDLANAASLAADEAAQEAGRRLAQALEPSLQLRLLDLLSEIALSLNSQVPGRVEVRLAGREPELVYIEEEEAEPAAAPPTTRSPPGSRSISDSLKGQIELAAARESLSVNSWIVRALARGSRPVPSVRAGA